MADVEEMKWRFSDDQHELCVCGHFAMNHANYMNMPSRCNQTHCGCNKWERAKLPADASPSEPQEKKAANIDVYEVEDKSDGYDYTVMRHDAMDAVLNTIWARLDALEDGETLTITYRKYTQEQMDEVYDHD
jgi:hypothetical protein